jgi:hypothetical protein
VKTLPPPEDQIRIHLRNARRALTELRKTLDRAEPAELDEPGPVGLPEKFGEPVPTLSLRWECLALLGQVDDLAQHNRRMLEGR